MSTACHRCGPVKHEAPTVLCVPCVLAEQPEGPYTVLMPEMPDRVVVSDESFDQVTAAIQNSAPPSPALVSLMRFHGHDPALAHGLDRELAVRAHDPDASRAKPREPNSQHVAVYLTKGLMAELDAACEALGETRYAYVRRAAIRALRGE